MEYLETKKPDMLPGCVLVGNENALEACSTDVEMLEGYDTLPVGAWLR
jgi:hypothetical protein